MPSCPAICINFFVLKWCGKSDLILISSDIFHSQTNKAVPNRWCGHLIPRSIAPLSHWHSLFCFKFILSAIHISIIPLHYSAPLFLSILKFPWFRVFNCYYLVEASPQWPINNMPAEIQRGSSQCSDCKPVNSRSFVHSSPPLCNIVCRPRIVRF